MNSASSTIILDPSILISYLSKIILAQSKMNYAPSRTILEALIMIHELSIINTTPSRTILEALIMIHEP